MRGPGGLITGDKVSSAAAIKDGANIFLIFINFTSCWLVSATALFPLPFFHDSHINNNQTIVVIRDMIKYRRKKKGFDPDETYEVPC